MKMDSIFSSSSSGASNLVSPSSPPSHSTASNVFDYYEFKRSRSNSPNLANDLMDLSYLDLEECESSLSLTIETSDCSMVSTILLNNNLLREIPPIIMFFQNLKTLDFSCNSIKIIHEDICKLVNLKNLIIKDNLLEDTSLPKEMGSKLTNLEVINLSGNLFTQFPYQLLEMRSLREIYLGSNKIGILPKNYENLQRVEILYLGGNQLKAIPDELCQLRNLSSLNLSNNQITSLPNNIAKLRNIKNLALHGNDLTTLPIELVKLNIHELSLRNNPLVSRFAREFSYNVPSLLELSGRVIKSKNIPYNQSNLPKHLVQYLNSAQCCLNPKCKGVYFTSKVEHIKFVDFCGKFRVPLMQYLCSSSCNEKISHKDRLYSEATASGSDSDDQVEDRLLKKILIG